MERERGRNLFLLAAAGSILIGFFLRLYLLGDKSIWWDEGLSVWASRKSFLEIARWTGSDVHPPLYFWILKVWRWSFGESAWALRFFSVWVGTLFIAAIGYFGRRVGGWVAGAIASLFLATHVFAIWWSQEMRMYELAALLLCFSTLFFLRWLEERKSRNVLLYAVFTWLALHTLYLSIFVVLAQDVAAVAWAVSERNFRSLVPLGIGQAATGILSLPWAAYAYTHMSTWSVSNHLPAWKFAELYFTLMVTGISTNVEKLAWVAGAWAALSLVAFSLLFVSLRKKRGKMSVFLSLAFWFVVPPIGVYGVSALKHLFYTPKPEARYMLISLPAFLLLLAWSISSVENRSFRLLAVALVLGSYAFFLRNYYPGRWLKDDFISISAALRKDREADELVVLHTDRDWPVFAAHYSGSFVGVPSGQRISEGWVKWFLEKKWDSNGGIWLVQTPDSLRMDPQHLVERWLDQKGRKVVSFQVGERMLILYRRIPRRKRREEPATSARIFIKRALVGDVTALMLCSPDGTGKRFRLYIGGTLWLEGTYRGKVECELFPVSFPDLPGKHEVTLDFAGLRMSLGDVRIFERKVKRSELPEKGLTRTNYEWEGGLKLLGYKVEDSHVQAGDKVKVIMLWRSGPPTRSPEKLFVHLLGRIYNMAQGNFLWGQKDSEPMDGKMPSTSWRKGLVWTEAWAIPVDPKAPPGTYRLEIGWYDPVTGERLKLVSPKEVSGGDSAIIAEVTVERR